MRHRHAVAVHRLGAAIARDRVDPVDHQLMTVEREVDPPFVAAPLRTAERPAVEGARGGEIVDGDRQVERAQAHRRPF